MITVRTQDKLYRFPDDTPQDVMKGAIDRYLGISPTLDDNKPVIAPTEPDHEEAMPIDETIDKTPISETKIQFKNEIKPPVQESKVIEIPIPKKPSNDDIMHLRADIQSLKTALTKAKTKKAINRLNKEIKERQAELEELKNQ